MDKKKYQQPTTWVVELQHQSQLLAGSIDLYGGPLGARSFLPTNWSFVTD